MNKGKLRLSIKNALKKIKEGKKSPYDYYFPMNFILERRLVSNEQVLQRKLIYYNDLPQDVKNILQNMYYQLGNKLFNFVKTLHYVETGKYKAAAIEMLDSLWAKQTPNRAKELSEAMGNCD